MDPRSRDHACGLDRSRGRAYVAMLGVAGALGLAGCASYATPVDAGADGAIRTAPDADATTWDASLQVENTGGATVAGVRYASSTRLAVRWRPPGSAVDHYVVRATDARGAHTVSTTAGADATGATLTELRSATRYTVSLVACLDAPCDRALAPRGGTAEGTTGEEVWQFHGTGSSVAGLTRVVRDGNARIHAIRFGREAPAELAGRVQLYYGPMPSPGMALPPSLAIGASDRPATPDPASLTAFTSLAGRSGLISPPAAAPLVRVVATGQAVPIRPPLGEGVRLYFEAAGADNRTRILSLDSDDGYRGRDFNAGPSEVCSTTEDYSDGGGCRPAVAIGVQGDAASGSPRLANVRQFKIGYPTRDDYRWDGAAGTFMVFTTDQVPGCSMANFNQGYAVWGAGAWHVQYREDGCPRLFGDMQAATPLHLGGVRYKLYFGTPSMRAGARPDSRLPFLGPKRVLYADGREWAMADRVDFEDWESQAEARDITFLWPSGQALDDGAEGYIDDFVVLHPTDDPDVQVMYTAITDGVIAPIAAACTLVNP